MAKAVDGQHAGCFVEGGDGDAPDGVIALAVVDPVMNGNQLRGERPVVKKFVAHRKCRGLGHARFHLNYLAATGVPA